VLPSPDLLPAESLFPEPEPLAESSSTSHSSRRRRDRTGREQRRRSSTARARRPDLSRYYARRLPPITPGDFEFSLDSPQRGRRALKLDPLVEAFEWSEEGAAMAGSVSLRRSAITDAASIPLTRGSLVRCRVRWRERWYELWTMRVERPSVTVETGSVGVSLVDDLAVVRRGRRRYVFRTTARRRHGWFGHEMLRHAAPKDGIKLGAIARCTRRMEKVDMRGSFLDLAVRVYRHERDETGRKFILRMRDGKFEVVPYARNRILYVLADQLASAIVAEEPKVENPVTVLTGRARVGKGEDAKKVVHTEFRRDVVARLGYSHRERNYGRLSSSAALRRRVRRDLARELRVEKTVTLQFPGIPFIRRGDAEQLVLPSEGFKGEHSFVFVSRIHHQVQMEGGYLCDADFTVRDPFVSDKARQEREARARKRRERRERAAA